MGAVHLAQVCGFGTVELAVKIEDEGSCGRGAVQVSYVYRSVIDCYRDKMRERGLTRSAWVDGETLGFEDKVAVCAVLHEVGGDVDELASGVVADGEGHAKFLVFGCYGLTIVGLREWARGDCGGRDEGSEESSAQHVGGREGVSSVFRFGYVVEILFGGVLGRCGGVLMTICRDLYRRLEDKMRALRLLPALSSSPMCLTSVTSKVRRKAQVRGECCTSQTGRIDRCRCGCTDL